MSSGITPGRVIYLKLPANDANAFKPDTNLVISQCTTIASFTTPFMTSIVNLRIHPRVVTGWIDDVWVHT
jgi:hypothetical protein